MSRSLKLTLYVWILCFIVNSCASLNSNSSKPSKLQILYKTQELQSLVIDLQSNNAITKERADLIISFTMSTTELLQNERSELEWRLALIRSWKQLKAKIKQPEYALTVQWTQLDEMIK